MTLNIVSLVASVVCALAAAKLISIFAKRFQGKPIPFGIAYALVLLVSGIAVGSLAAAIGASQWAILGCLAIVCGGVTLGFLIPALAVQTQLRKERDAF